MALTFAHGGTKYQNALKRVCCINPIRSTTTTKTLGCYVYSSVKVEFRKDTTQSPVSSAIPI